VGVTITCYGGVGEIGGNNILVTDRDTKVLLDFGAGFSEGDRYFSAGIQPRSYNGAREHFQFRKLTEKEDLNTEAALQNTQMGYTSPEIDAILLSHYHYDHTGRINFVDAKIPVYCGETTKLIHEAQSGSTGSPLDDHVIETFRTGDKFAVGGLEVEPIHVDHSIPGSYGLILHTSEGPIAYTGDFRFHGPMGVMTEDFVEGAAKSKPLALVTEGTRVSETGRAKELSEPDVVRETVRVLEKTENLVFSSFRGNDVDRVVSLHQACEQTGRTLVVSTKIAVLLEKLIKDRHLRVPRVGKDVLVYIRRKRQGNYDEGDYYKWEKAFLDDGITAEEVQRKQKSTLLHLDQRNFPELIDIKPAKEGSYIHSATEAYNEEGEQEEEVIKNWVEYFGFSYHQIHASGHAPSGRVGYLVNKIGGRAVIPIHTERPDLFSSLAKNCRILAPKKGTEIQLA
jgi:ribonuclease J